MYANNQNVMSVLSRIEEESQECREAIQNCMKYAGAETCVDLLTQDIRQEVVDLLHFTMAIARLIGMDSQMLMSDAVEKFARNMARYPSSDFQDLSSDFGDQQEKSRSWDKRRGFTKDFYQIAA